MVSWEVRARWLAEVRARWLGKQRLRTKTKYKTMFFSFDFSLFIADQRTTKT